MKSLKAVQIKPKRDASVPVLQAGEYCILDDLVHCRAPDGTVFACTLTSGLSFRSSPEAVKNRDGSITINTMPYGWKLGDQMGPWLGSLVKDVWKWDTSDGGY